MTFYHAGLVFARCEEHEKAAEIDSTMLAVLGAMATFAKDESDPRCYASQAAIAKRAHVERRTAQYALTRLERLGMVERDGKRGKTINWRLSLLCAPDAHKEDLVPTGSGTGTRNHNSAPRAHKNSAPRAHKNSAPRAHNPSDTPEVIPREDRSATRSADAPRFAGSDVAVVSARLGLAASAAEAWIVDKLDGRNVRNPEKYIKRCIERELAARNAADGRTGEGGTLGTDQAASSSPRPGQCVEDGGREEGIAAVEEGNPDMAVEYDHDFHMRSTIKGVLSQYSVELSPGRVTRIVPEVDAAQRSATNMAEARYAVHGIVLRAVEAERGSNDAIRSAIEHAEEQRRYYRREVVSG
jgi:hypothetical protein